MQNDFLHVFAAEIKRILKQRRLTQRQAFEERSGNKASEHT